MTMDSLEAQIGETRLEDEAMSEYIRRVASETDIADERIEGLISDWQRAAFSPDRGLSLESNETVSDLADMYRAAQEEEENRSGTSDDASGTDDSEWGDNSTHPNNSTLGASGGVQSWQDVSHLGSMLVTDILSDIQSVSEFSTIRSKHPTTTLSQYLIRERSDLVWMGLIVLIGILVYLPQLGGSPLRPFDEGTYSNLAYDIAHRGHWLAPYYDKGGVDYQPYFEKPPLYFWLEAVSILIFGATNFAARFPSACFAIFTGVLAYIIGRDMISRTTGFTAAVVWLTTQYVFAGFNAGRMGGVQTQTVFLGTLFVFSVWKYSQNDAPSSWLAVMGASAGLLVLGKGFAAGIYPIVSLPLVILSIRKFVDRRVIYMGILAAILALPWIIYMSLTYGDEFIHVFVIVQVIGRVTGSSGFQSTQGLFSWEDYPFIATLPMMFGPWLYFAFTGFTTKITQGIVTDDHQRAALALFLSWWSGFIFFFFAYTGNHPWYTMAMYVPAGLLVGWLVDGLFDPKSRLLSALGIAVAMCFALLFSPRLPSLAIIPFPTRGVVTTTHGVVSFLIPFGVAVIAVIVLAYVQDMVEIGEESSRNGAKFLCSGVISALIVISIVGTTPVVINHSTKDAQMEQLGKSIQSTVPSGETLYVETPVRSETGVLYPMSYHSRRIHRAKSIKEFNRNGQIRYALILSSDKHRLTRRYAISESMTIGKAKVSVVKFRRPNSS